ncbi:U-box domain-containing protein 35-like isoform X2 [Andrographis paniculata]|uniref:U-box domain-containing protein 35-like isoform X2 n=1 Tax=Andrographis paniculata TaxID=175694 RepID=UPI0021E88305|nr:U-box domain-containing protein 35-like isoform X2 [Andrographis paniculata]
MGEKEIRKMEGFDVNNAALAESVVALAISGSSKSKYVVKWALEKFVPEGQVYFKILHVRPVISRIPTPIREDVVKAFRKELEWQAKEKLLPYKKMCSQRKVQVEIVQIESDDVVEAIAGDIQRNKIAKLVIATSSRNIFSRTPKLSSMITEGCPMFCTVYAVSKGKLSSIRPANSEPNERFIEEEEDDASETSSTSTDNYTNNSLSSRTDWTDQGSVGSYSNYRSSSLPAQRFQALSAINQSLLHKRMPSGGVVPLKDLPISGFNAIDGTTMAPSLASLAARDSLLWDQASTSDISSENQVNVDFEVERLRTELRHIRGMYAMAQTEATDASRKLSELQKRRLQEDANLKQISIKEEEAKEFARKVKERYEAAIREAELIKDCVEREAAERKEAEIRALHETKEKEKLESTLTGGFNLYRQFTWEEIESATSSFSDDLKIGMGAYGAVYKCSFLHTTAAVKVLHSTEATRDKQFQQELEILSRIRHPHLMILLGACPERSCLVYEFMENGSLEDILMKKPRRPLLWHDRFRIAWEVASALVFLHSTKPRAIIHRDLKPANILLDRNYVSKIGDVGLSTMVNRDALSLSAAYKDTAPVGTMYYIDPEYQRTGVVSPKSDVYAFGMVVLQLLTGKQAIALAHKVEVAISKGRFAEVLDPEAGAWPVEETRELALVALQCTELRRIDRPELEEQVFPLLERMKDFAEEARDSAAEAMPPPPKHFLCPILKGVMEDPCVAGDGYTYDRKGIESWLEANDTSPMTESPLPHKYLVPNYTLLSAIMEWKSGKYEAEARF